MPAMQDVEDAIGEDQGPRQRRGALGEALRLAHLRFVGQLHAPIISVGGDDAVAPGLLGDVERAVGLLQHVAPALAVGR